MSKLSDILGKGKTFHPSSKIAQALKRAGVSDSPELRRILALPRRKFDELAYEDVSILYAKPACGVEKCSYCKNGAPKLKPIQSAMLHEAAIANGGFFNVGVGKGKTLASFLMHDVMRAQRTVLLVPPNLRLKTLKKDYPELDRHFSLPPIYDADQAGTGKPGVYVVAYSELSATDASDLLDQIKPDLIVADEAHALARPAAARTRRFKRFMAKNQCRFVCMSGTLAKRSIKDFAHLIELALGKNSPIPADFRALEEWAAALDAKGKDFSMGPGALELFCNPGETLESGFKRRLIETPGVISTTDLSASNALEIRLVYPKVPEEVTEALHTLGKTWSWDGELYDKALEIARVERQLTQGFYYRLIWPNGKDQEWLDARNAWHREVRTRLQHTNRVGMDSPALLRAAAERGDWACSAFHTWQAIEDRVAPEKEAIEVSQWLVDVVGDWAQTGAPGIVWVDSPVVGQWLAQEKIPYFGAGDDQALLDYIALCEKDPTETVTIACSIKAHGTGKNLQKVYWRNLVLYPPASGDTWQQMIGRTHRPEQPNDIVTFDVVLASPSAIRAFEQARADSRWFEDVKGQPQLLNMATYVEK